MGDEGLEHQPELSEKPSDSAKRGTNSGTFNDHSAFADAVAAIMRLPLSDAEKAEAVRRLLTR